MKELVIGALNSLGLAYWVKIDTTKPSCIYYFGPFLTVTEAKNAKAGYIEDLTNEGCSGIEVEIKRCKPSELTVFDNDELEGGMDFNPVPAYFIRS
ncbi:MAG: DUF1816 domain-containing protein [Xenococcaceae cyanobacterium MO_167.B52]|nr:DUF1816 domain-containing protein [Xenococcaceae cyanobacterium MO_167.B52]